MEIRILGKERSALHVVVIKKDISVEPRSVQSVTGLAECAVLLAISELNVHELVSMMVVALDSEGIKMAKVLMVEEKILEVDGRGRHAHGHGRSQETTLVADGNYSFVVQG